MPRATSRNANQSVSDFDKGRIVAYRNCGLSYLSIAARVGKDRMTHQYGHIHVRFLRGKRKLAACIHHSHTGASSGMMVWGAIGYKSRSPLVRTLNSAHYIYGVLRPVGLPFIRVLRNPAIKQDNARPQVAFLDTENVRLFP
ncbi:transposable element Tcb1 transposase [Trichonephila clavipes]|nr:transposable element Tcb1 transposase [Trichonephila clavipes]